MFYRTICARKDIVDPELAGFWPSLTLGHLVGLGGNILTVGTNISTASRDLSGLAYSTRAFVTELAVHCGFRARVFRALANARATREKGMIGFLSAHGSVKFAQGLKYFGTSVEA
ncbi:hypothetical protein C8F04DRAFT_1188285 [Mycena alexandri]|uniref:Uncharacterized protein n=1 Tax=Mycena alexandri TaxID=1745969 RepID=A0AAD6WVG6_9AGAR|nr:hypothetical protein C8F04DRAFT_1188285 [Mycena alexandri]